MVGHGGSSAGSYLADPTSPIPSHCASIVVTSTLRVNVFLLQASDRDVHEAVLAGDATKLDDFLSMVESVQRKDMAGLTIQHKAVLGGNLVFFETPDALRLHINVTDNVSPSTNPSYSVKMMFQICYNILQYCTKHCNKNVVHFQCGRTPLHYAVEDKNLYEKLKTLGASDKIKDKVNVYTTFRT